MSERNYEPVMSVQELLNLAAQQTAEVFDAESLQRRLEQELDVARARARELQEQRTRAQRTVEATEALKHAWNLFLDLGIAAPAAPEVVEAMAREMAPAVAQELIDSARAEFETKLAEVHSAADARAEAAKIEADKLVALATRRYEADVEAVKAEMEAEVKRVRAEAAEQVATAQAAAAAAQAQIAIETAAAQNNAQQVIAHAQANAQVAIAQAEDRIRSEVRAALAQPLTSLMSQGGLFKNWAMAVNGARTFAKSFGIATEGKDTPQIVDEILAKILAGETAQAVRQGEEVES